MDGVLEYTCTIAERKEMSDPHLRNAVPLALRDDRINRKRYSRSGALARSLEYCEIALGRLRPRQRSACRVGPFAHGMTADVVFQQACNLSAYGFGIPKGNQNATPVTQQFLGVPVGCRYDCLSQSKAVGECARCHLGFI